MWRQRNIKLPKKHFYKSFLFILLPLLVINTTASLYVYINDKDEVYSDVRNSLNISMLEISNYLEKDLYTVQSDLNLISSLTSHSSTSAIKLDSFLLNLAKSRQYYNHISYLNSLGDEFIRIDKVAPDSFAIARQNRNFPRCSFIKDIIKSKKGSVIINATPLPGGISFPSKSLSPAILFGAATRDKVGKKTAVVLSLDGAYLMQHLSKVTVHDESDFFIIDSASAYSQSFVSDSISSDLLDISIKKVKSLHNEIWPIIKGREEGIDNSNSAYFSFFRVSFHEIINRNNSSVATPEIDNSYYFVKVYKSSIIDEKLASARFSFISSIIVGTLLSLVIALLFGRYWKRKKTFDYQQIEFSNYLFDIINSLSFPFRAINIISSKVEMANKAAEISTEQMQNVYIPFFIKELNIIDYKAAKLKDLFNRKLKDRIAFSIDYFDPESNKTYEIYYQVIHDAHGNLTSIIEYEIDITKRKAMEQKLLEYNDELEEAVEKRTQELQNALSTLANQVEARKATQNELKEANDKLKISLEKEKLSIEYMQRLIENLAHEYRTPLTNILSSVELLDIYYLTSDKEKFQKKVASVKDTILVMSNINNEAVKAAEILSSNSQESETTNLSGVLSDIARRFEFSNKQEFKYDIEKGLFTDMPMKSLSIIIENVLKNATAYSEEGTIIEVTLRAGSHNSILQIKDHGQGIPPKELPEVTKPFYRGSLNNNVGTVRGLGLGLYITKKILTDYAGSIEIDSEYNHGTIVTIKIPKTEVKHNFN